MGDVKCKMHSTVFGHKAFCSTVHKKEREKYEGEDLPATERKRTRGRCTAWISSPPQADGRMDEILSTADDFINSLQLFPERPKEHLGSSK